VKKRNLSMMIRPVSVSDDKTYPAEDVSCSRPLYPHSADGRETLNAMRITASILSNEDAVNPHDSFYSLFSLSAGPVDTNSLFNTHSNP